MRTESLIGGFKEGAPLLKAQNDSIVVCGTLANTGECARVSMPEIDSSSFPPKIHIVEKIIRNGLPGAFTGDLVFTEKPLPGRVEEQEIASGHVVTEVRSGLPELFTSQTSIPKFAASVRSQDALEREVSLDLALRAAQGLEAAVREITNRANSLSAH